MKESSPSCQKEPTSVQKIKLLCSFNGVFQPRPPSGKLRYVGGETHIVSAYRNIGILRLRSKIYKLFPNIPSFSLKYQLPESDGSDGEVPLVLIATDDDVRCMIDEYDKLESGGRLWVFIFADDGYVGPNPDFSFNMFCYEMANLCSHVAGIQDSGNPMSLKASEPKVQSASSAPRIQYPDNPFKIPVTHLPGNQNFGSLVYGGEFDAGSSNQSVATVQFSKQERNPSMVSMSTSSNVEQSMRNIESVSMGNLNRENVMPRTAYYNAIETCLAPASCTNPLVGRGSPLKPSVTSNRAWDNHQCRFRNHRFGKCYDPGLRPSSNILKHGQAMRSHYSHFSKPWSGVKYTRGILTERVVQPIHGRCPVDHANRHGGLRVGPQKNVEIPGAVTSLVDLSFYNLSLSSSKEVESSPRCEMGSKSNLVDQLEKDLAHAKNQQAIPSIDEKAKVVGGICSDLAVLHTHLANQELQTIKNSDLEEIRKLGSGTYGTVFYGKWKGSDVAIKRIKPSCFTGGELEQNRLIMDFWKEAHILGRLHHPNIVAFYGVVTDGPASNLATVTEYMVNGSLKQVLQKKDRTVDRRKRQIIAMEAAFGMEYLHEKNIVHFDLKSHNFLVNMRDPLRPVCKIGDLGLSKVKQKTLVSGGVRGTIPWMAPELLTSKKNMVTDKVDVYSFGIVMWELLTGEEPYADMRSKEIIAGIIRGDLRPDVPSWCDPVWRSLMERCWSSDPNSRPPFSEIAKELRAMAAAMNIQ